MLEATAKPRQGHPLAASDLLGQLECCRTFPAVLETALESDPCAWLASQADDFKLVWRDRGATQLMVGLGTAERITAAAGEGAASIIDRCRGLLAGLPEQRVYGGFAFCSDGVWENSPWQSFGRASFWLPRATLRDGYLRVVVISAADVSPTARFVRRLVETQPDASPSPLPHWTRRVDRPDQLHWTDYMAKAMRLFEDEVLEKIVLARQVDIDFAYALNPLELFRQLAPATPACYHFCFQTAPHVGFVGASPERLFWRHGQQLRSEVVAGTRPRGAEPQEDQRLADELLGCSKDHLEHDIVRKSIRQRLHACVQRIDVDAKASLLRLANKQHLYSRVRAVLREGVSDGMLLDRLHPTPAVGGYPTENALDEIRRLEPFQRGWYAAPVGWIGQGEAEFAVAIRSGLVHGDRLTLYSGAGIVPGSRAAAEWDEVEQKISDFLQLLTPAAGLADVASR
jgi:menaquinone-specific isochorismate synthase